ncbi:ABC-type (unclassified) transport system, ATPase component [Thermanaerovibrio velox DSM 12556]|uniref:ABC-type (Unclassified) transport system, ATPase component n=1 Tax=Thermanaerovibrio velox DSM 12556 TaxID=926567 RepID=H0UQD5_9BACT|nr:LPS export ABC transporter ATP-binding protein [Thermanaerovibrio velox]EHM09689.1 ABC-type (unclassified) transport system, ATPase component [Thermanaerovibrio velox DSM 12556]
MTVVNSSGSLEVVNLGKSYRGRRVVDGVSFTVRRGCVTGLLGPNGAGKSTTFYMTVGRIRPDEGSVILNGEDVTRLSMHLRARRGLGYLPQEASVFRNLTVRQNLELVYQELGWEERDYAPQVDRLIEEFGIGVISDTKGYALSGGERRRVEIARCVALKPSFLLLDEPFSGIDPIAVYDIQQMIISLKEKGFGILLTDHNVRETLSITDVTYLIHQGRVVIQGTPEEVAESPVARKFYLGEEFRW